MTTEELIGTTVLILGACFPPAMILWLIQRARAAVRSWAERQELKLHKLSLRLARRGPFLWGTSRAQHVFRVVATDPQGQRRSGFVRVGDTWRGVLTPRIEVRWDQTS